MKKTAWLLLLCAAHASAQDGANSQVSGSGEAGEDAPFSAPPLLDSETGEAPRVAAGVSSVADAPVASVLEDRTRFGVALDVGVPDGVGASLVFRPFNWLRLSVGATTTLFSTGFRGGVALVPFHFWITPSLNFDAGYLPEGDANSLVRTFGGDASFNSPALSKVSYAYANAHLGLEVGSPRRFSISLRGGLSYVDGAIGGFQAMLQQADPTLESRDLRVRGTVPSAKLGFLLYFL